MFARRESYTTIVRWESVSDTLLFCREPNWRLRRVTAVLLSDCVRGVMPLAHPMRSNPLNVLSNGESQCQVATSAPSA